MRAIIEQALTQLFRVHPAHYTWKQKAIRTAQDIAYAIFILKQIKTN